MSSFFRSSLWGVHITSTLHMPPYIAVASSDKDYIKQTAERITESVKSAARLALESGFGIEPPEVKMKKLFILPTRNNDYSIVNDGSVLEFVPYFFMVSHGVYDESSMSLTRRFKRVDIQVMNFTEAQAEEEHARLYANLFKDPRNEYTVLYREQTAPGLLVEHMVTLDPRAIPVEETNFKL